MNPITNANTAFLRSLVKPPAEKPAATRREQRDARQAAADTLTLSQAKPRTDGQPRQPLFNRMDADGSNRVSRAELAAWQGNRQERRDARAAVPAPPAPPAEPAAPPAFGYQTKHAHGVDKLAQDFGVTPQALMDANGWTDAGKQVPAGSKVNVPDSPETRALAAGYGGQVSEATPPGSLPAEPQPGEAGAPGGLNEGGIGIAGDPNRVHMTQFVHEQWNNSPNAPWGSANCGPASLAMGLKAIGLEPAGLPAGADTEGWIDASRQAMDAMIDPQGRQGDSAYTDVGQIIAGAEASGATATQVGWEGLDAALAQGLPVVVAGNPAAYNANWVAEGISNSRYDGGHFITVTGRDAAGNYVINDPLSNVGATTISPDEMYGYGAYFGWSASVSLAP